MLMLEILNIIVHHNGEVRHSTTSYESISKIRLRLLWSGVTNEFPNNFQRVNARRSLGISKHSTVVKGMDDSTKRGGYLTSEHFTVILCILILLSSDIEG